MEQSLNSRILEIAAFKNFDKGLSDWESFWPATGIKLDFQLSKGKFQSFFIDDYQDLSPAYIALIKGTLVLLENQNWIRLEQLSFREVESFLREDNTQSVLEDKLYKDFWEDFIWRFKVLCWQNIEGIQSYTLEWNELYEDKLKALKRFFEHHLNPKISFSGERIDLISLEEKQVCVSFRGNLSLESWKLPALKEIFAQFFSDKGLYLVVEGSQIS